MLLLIDENMQVLISKVRSHFIYRHVAISKSFSWVSGCDERIGVAGFLEKVCYHVEFQFLRTVPRA